MNKYYRKNTNTERRHKKISRRKKVETVCGIIAFTSFLYLLGAVGGLEQGTLTMGKCIAQSIVSLAVMITSARVIGAINE